MKQIITIALLVWLLLAGASLPGVQAHPAAQAPRQDAVSAAPGDFPLSPGLATGSIGGYTESIGEVAFGVQTSGRIHVLWTGTLNPAFGLFVFYSSSADGVNWSPYQILSYWAGYEPKVVIDDARNRVHLVYRVADEGIIHRVAANGALSGPVVLGTGSVSAPKLALDPASGRVHAVWQIGRWHPVPGALEWRYRARYAYWNGATWSGAVRVINDADVNHVAVAAADGQTMLAWFQGWAATRGESGEANSPTVPRTATGTAVGKFPLRQAVSGVYPMPETDESIMLAYSSYDDRFYMLCSHFMWPGHSVIYRYIWNGSWSAAKDISGNAADWAAPIYLGTASGAGFTYYAYRQNGFWARTETNGVLGAPQNIGQYLAGRGYTGTPVFFLAPGGTVHMVVAGKKDGADGLWYLRQ
jgi:hypothetical protein